MFFQFYLTSSMRLRRTKYVCMHCKLEISAGSGSWQYTRALFGFRSSSGRFILNSIGVGSSLVGAIGAQRPDLDKYFGIGLHICFILKKSSKKLFLFSLFFFIYGYFVNKTNRMSNAQKSRKQENTPTSESGHKPRNLFLATPRWNVT